MKFVEATDFMLLLLVDIMSLLDLDFIGNNKILLVILFGQCLIFLLP